jgi:3-oxoacyl-[acyl-carrier-protein] synthase-3
VIEQRAYEMRPWLSNGSVGVLGMGVALPGSPVETAALIELMRTRFGFGRHREALAIANRMGIHARYHCRSFEKPLETAREGQSNPELAAQAVQAALLNAGMNISDIGYLIGHTTTPHQPLPANIALVADILGFSGPHLELRQACTGFANALMIAFGLLAGTGGRPVAIVGSETGSLFFDPTELASNSGQIINLVQMGDGASAIIIGAREPKRPEINAAWFGSIGLGREPGIQQHAGHIGFDHDFSGIYKSGYQLFEASCEAAAQMGFRLDDAHWVIPHQVSGRIGHQVANYFGLEHARPYVNADVQGNTGSAAIWLALTTLRTQGLKANEQVIVLGAEASKYMYGGFSYIHR